MELANAFVPPVPLDIAERQRRRFTDSPATVIGEEETRMLLHDPSFFHGFYAPMRPVELGTPQPLHDQVVARITPAGVAAVRSCGSGVSMLYVYACLADAIERHWLEHPETLVVLPRYGPHQGSVLAASHAQVLDEGLLRRALPDVAAASEFLSSIYSRHMAAPIARWGYAALRMCADLEPHIPVIAPDESVF